MAGGPVVVCMGETAAVEAGDALLAMEEAPPPSPAPPTPLHTRLHTPTAAASRASTPHRV